MSRKPTLDLTDDLRAIQQAAANYRANPMSNETPIVPSGTFTVRPEFMAEIEFTIIRGLVRRALAAGYSITVIDDPFGAADGEKVVTDSRDAAHIIGALCSTGGDLLILREACGKRAGWIQLVYNGDEDVVADHSPNLPAGILDAAVRS